MGAIEKLQAAMGGMKDDAMNIALLGGSAAAGMVAAELAVQKIPKVKDFFALNPNYQGPAVILIGVAGGIAVSRFVKGDVGAKIGAGIATGLVGWGLYTTAKWALNKYVFKEAGAALAGWGQVFGDAANFAALGQSRRDEDLLLGLGAIKTETRDVKQFPGYTPTEGLGQGLEVRTIRPVPGMSGVRAASMVG